MIIGILKSFDPNLNTTLFPNLVNSLVGGFFGYTIIWLIIFTYKKIRNKEGMGLGDAKLLSAIGFWFGWMSIPFIIFFSSIAALISVIPDLITNKKKLSSQIPFGPFIIIGTLIFLFSNDYIKIFLN
jgi:leader peptidase (prepilin peptidase)/N-methyltransferase|tara:strand:+ start:530 stop:910 length:381 start_codon:yes stop_codon:yes gene_type:complete